MSVPADLDLQELRIDVLTQALAEIPPGEARDAVRNVRDSLRESLRADIDRAGRLERLRGIVAEINAHADREAA